MATRTLSAAVGVALLALSIPAPTAAVQGTELNKITYVTFSQPVRLPGVTLGAGTYIFELADPINQWKLVRVSSRDRRIVYLTAFTHVVERPEGVGPTQAISFGEGPGGMPQPIVAWWPQGESTGRLFIY